MPKAFPILPIDAVLPDLCAVLETGTNAVLQAPPGRENDQGALGIAGKCMAE